MADQKHGLYEQEKFREMPTMELRDCIQQDTDSSRAQRAQKVLSERGESPNTSNTYKKTDEGNKKADEGKVRQGGGQRGMGEEGGPAQAGFGDERKRGDARDVRDIDRDN